MVFIGPRAHIGIEAKSGNAHLIHDFAGAAFEPDNHKH
jgi:hypothetical protein